MQLTKKQVKSLLDVISSDETRPILTHAKIDTYEGRPVLVATDSYKLAAITLTDDVLPIMGYVIPREDILKWYKLANHKDYFTETDIMPIAKEDNGGYDDKPQYPEWQKLITGQKPEALFSLRINADFMLTMQVLAGCNDYAAGMAWEFNGDLAPVIARHNQNIYVVMPLKK